MSSEGGGREDGGSGEIVSSPSERWYPGKHLRAAVKEEGWYPGKKLVEKVKGTKENLTNETDREAQDQASEKAEEPAEQEVGEKAAEEVDNIEDADNQQAEERTKQEAVEQVMQIEGGEEQARQEAGEHALQKAEEQVVQEAEEEEEVSEFGGEGADSPTKGEKWYPGKHLRAAVKKGVETTQEEGWYPGKKLVEKVKDTKEKIRTGELEPAYRPLTRLRNRWKKKRTLSHTGGEKVGTLHVSVLEAKQLRTPRPYMIVAFDGNEERTSTATSASPTWAEAVYEFPILDPSSDLCLFLFDDKSLKNETCIGRIIVPLCQLCRPPLLMQPKVRLRVWFRPADPLPLPLPCRRSTRAGSGYSLRQNKTASPRKSCTRRRFLGFLGVVWRGPQSH
jgi:hypothetical protein